MKINLGGRWRGLLKNKKIILRENENLAGRFEKMKIQSVARNDYFNIIFIY